jgi:hypothetical protein
MDVDDVPKAPEAEDAPAQAAPKRKQRSDQRLKPEETIWIRVPWSRHDYKQCRLQEFLRSSEATKAHPVPHLVKSTNISYSLNRPLSTLFGNFSRVHKEPLPDNMDVATNSCPCQHYRTPAALSYDGHVISTDPSVFKDNSLRQLWLCGRKFRTLAHPDLLLQDVRRGLGEYVDQICRRCKLDPDSFATWVTLVTSHLEKTANNISDVHWMAQGGLTSQGVRELRRLRDVMVVGPTDKSAHDFMYVCKRAYLRGLAAELGSATYAGTPKTDEEITKDHAEQTGHFGRLPVNALPYLYGAGKLHKEVASMRWIAGCSVQKVHATPTREYFAPSTSISATAAALGGVLRFCMAQLEQKDIKEYRPRRVRRYWVVTSVDAVAKHLKVHQRDLAQEDVWTEDFTTMYTKLPLDRILQGVSAAVVEAFSYFLQGRQQTEVNFNLRWTNDGRADVEIHEKGAFRPEMVPRWIEAVLHGTFLKQGPDKPTLQQVIGIPMGGKCSAELANLYCYSVESAVIDKLLAAGRTDVAQSMYHTFRYIDDILGFGHPHWELLNYGMEHRRTSEDRRKAVFLGMSIDTSGDFIMLRMEPKGAGWKWKPQRYVDWSSVHTRATKKFLLKGLLVRAGTVTNTLAAFKDAVEYFLEGLIARNFGKRDLTHSMESYLQDYWSEFPHQATQLRKWFHQKLVGAFGRPRLPGNNTEATTSQAPPTTTAAAHPPPRQGTLLCGLDAINHIMISRSRMPVQRDMLDDIAAHVASLEAAISEPNGLVAQAEAAGNYHVTAMSLAVHHLTDLHVHVWTAVQDRPNQSFAYIVGDGRHWQAVVQEDRQWWLRDKQSITIRDLRSLLIARSKNGIVLACDESATGAEMDYDASQTRPSRKRTAEELTNPQAKAAAIEVDAEELTGTGQGAIEPTSPSSQALFSTQKTLAGSTASLLQLLADVPYTPLSEDKVTQESKRRSHSAPAHAPEGEKDWVEMPYGVATILHNRALGRYRCPTPGCKFQGLRPLQVSIHYNRYCRHGKDAHLQRSRPSRVKTEEIEGVEDKPSSEGPLQTFEGSAEAANAEDVKDASEDDVVDVDALASTTSPEAPPPPGPHLD